MNTSVTKSLILPVHLAIVVSMVACSSDSKGTRNSTNLNNQNQNTPLNNPTVITPTPAPQANKQYLNEQLFNRLDNADSSYKCNKWLFEEYLIRRLIAECFARTIIEPFYYFLDLSVSDL